jgi:hypothetical protein
LDPLREQITYEFVPRSDAVLFVLSARRILAQTEIDFLRDRILKADIQRIFFLVNFADVLSDRDYQRVRDYALNHLAPLVANPRLYMVSARRELRAITASETTATPSGFRELKRDLGRFLAEERGAFKMRRPLARGLRFCEELLRGPLALARNSIGLDLPDLKRRIETLTPQIRQLESERDACLAQLETALTNRRLELEHELRMGLNNVAHTAVNAVHKYGTRQNGPLKRQELARYLEQQIAPVQTAFQSRFAERQANALRDGSETVQQRSRDAFQSLDRSVQEIFAVCEAQPAFSTLDAPEAPQEQVDLAKPVGVAIGIAALGLSVFLPLAVLAGWVGSMLFRGWSDNKARLEALEQIRLEVDQRYRASIPAAVADFEKHWDETAKRMGASLKADFNRRRDEVRFQLTDAVAAHEGSVRSADERRLELDEIARQLEQIRNLLVAQQS